jgi:D-glycero-beta-D-manno-heptose-7-phosphate kinase
LVKSILIIGDSCLDIYIYGKCERLAPEGPVPVFESLYQTSNGGMSRNVYENLLSIGEKCDLVTNEEEITKTRYVEYRTNHCVVRVDSHGRRVERIKHMREEIDFKKYDAVIVSDYDHGFLTESDIDWISRQHPLVIMDTKKKLGEWCRNIKFIKINEYEYENTKHILDECDFSFDAKLIVTLSERGSIYRGESYLVEPVEVKDLAGAGDTFLTGFVSEYLKTKDTSEAIRRGNEYASIVVQHRGVSKVGDHL